MTPQEILKQQMDFCRVTEWHDAGFTGKGVTVYNCENISKDNFHPTATTLRQIAPDIILVTGSMSQTFSGNDMTVFDVHDDVTDTFIPFHEFIEKYRPKILSASVKGNVDSSEYVDYCIEMQEKYDLIINNCAGNEGEGSPDTMSHRFPDAVAFLIGAVNLIDGRVTKPTYSSIGETLDFMNFTGYQSGTSFATPWTAAEEAMIIQRYGNMSKLEMEKYLKMCIVDMGTPGHDVKTGWGWIRLPPVKNKYITLIIGEAPFFSDGREIIMDTVPVIVSGRTFVPIRAISEALGYLVSWNPLIKGITIKNGSKTVMLKINSLEMSVDGIKSALEVAPFIDSRNRTLVPLRAIAEAFGCKVDWIEKEKKVMILEV